MWVIWSTTQLWSGEGIIPSTKDDLYSGLAEAYGIFVVLQFFQNYLSHYPLILPTKLPIKLYCDNQGVIDRLQQPNNPLYPRDTIQDDYPIFREITMLLQTLQPLTVQLFHVTGHQDATKIKRPLTVPELLNVDCDERANKLNDTLMEPYEPYHPILPASYPHIQIAHSTIIRCLQSSLRDAATKPDYYKYLCDKYNWQPKDPGTVQWHTFQVAYNRLSKSEQKTIAKFNHNWLPLQISHYIHSTSEQQYCPSCRGHPETVDHFLQCPQPDRQHHWTELQDNLQKLFLRNPVPHELQELLNEGLWISRNNELPISQHI